MSLARRSFFAAISAALFVKPMLAIVKADDPQDFYAKVGPIVNGESKFTLTVMPSVVSVGIAGDLSGLFEGDFIRFHIEKSEVVWKGRHIHVRNVELTP